MLRHQWKMTIGLWPNCGTADGGRRDRQAGFRTPPCPSRNSSRAEGRAGAQVDRRFSRAGRGREAAQLRFGIAPAAISGTDPHWAKVQLPRATDGGTVFLFGPAIQ